MKRKYLLLFSLTTLSLIGCFRNERGIVLIVNDSKMNIYYDVYVHNSNQESSKLYSFHKDSIPYPLLRAGTSVSINLNGKYTQEDAIRIRYFSIDPKGDSNRYVILQMDSESIKLLDKSGWQPWIFKQK